MGVPYFAFIMSFNPQNNPMSPMFQPETKAQRGYATTQSRTGSVPGLHYGCRTAVCEKALGCPLWRASPGVPRAGSEPCCSPLPASPWLSGSPTHDVGPRFPRCQGPRFIFRSRVHASFTRRLLAGPQALLRETELPVKEAHCAPCQ